MKRRAIIIGNNTGKNAPTYLSGVNHDLKNYERYLRSAAGGEWFIGEILVLHNESRNNILSAIKKCDADYSFVIYSGHGFVNSKNDLTYACVSDGYITEDELNTRLYKQTLILDCCRESSPLFESFEGRALSKGIGDVQNLSERKQTVLNSRGKFDTALSQSGIGNFTGYACLIDQFSSDNASSGGAFSSELLRVGFDFASKSNPDGYWLPIEESVNEVSRRFLDNRLTQEQNPEGKKSSHLNITHPFAITNLETRINLW